MYTEKKKEKKIVVNKTNLSTSKFQVYSDVKFNLHITFY